MSRAEAPAEPTTPAGILAAADEAIIAADERLATVETLVRQGDESVTPEHLEAAQKQTLWARLRRDAATRKAAELAEQQARQGYADLLAADLGTAMQDPDEAATALLDEARELIRSALGLYLDRNRAIYRLARYFADPANYRDEDDEVLGIAYPGAGAIGSRFEYRGKRAAFRSTTHVFAELLRPLESEISQGEGGPTPEWLRGIR